MFGSSRREAEGTIRRLASKAWRRASGVYRQTSLRTAMFLQGASVDVETLAVTLDGERYQIMRIWSQLAVQSAGSIREAAQLSELAAAVELCLSRLLEGLAALPADQIDAPVLDPSQFAFARTLADFGRREGLPFDQLL